MHMVMPVALAAMTKTTAMTLVALGFEEECNSRNITSTMGTWMGATGTMASTAVSTCVSVSFAVNGCCTLNTSNNTSELLLAHLPPAIMSCRIIKDPQSISAPEHMCEKDSPMLTTQVVCHHATPCGSDSVNAIADFREQFTKSASQRLDMICLQILYVSVCPCAHE